METGLVNIALLVKKKEVGMGLELMEEIHKEPLFTVA